MAVSFELYNDRSGGFRWRLKSRDGEVLATSDWCTSKKGAQNGIDSLQKNAASATVDDQT